MPTLNDLINKRTQRAAFLAEEHGPDYEKVVRTMEVNKAEQATIDAWLESLKPEILAKQGTNDYDPDEPYYGTIGGGVTYSFTGTGLGYILVVKEATTGKELNVTQALDWHFFG